MDTTRTLEISAVCKVVAIFIVGPAAWGARCFWLFRATQSPNSEGAQLRLKYPDHWMIVGAVSSGLLIAMAITLGLQVCAILAPHRGGQLQQSVVKVRALHDSAEVLSPFGLQLNCSRYIDLEMPGGEVERLCYQRRRTPDALSAVEPTAGDYVSLQARSNFIATFVESLTFAASPSSRLD